MCPKPDFSGFSGEDFDPCHAPAHFKGLSNKNVQSASFKLLQRALESNNNNNNNEEQVDHEQSESAMLLHCTAKAPKVKGTQTPQSQPANAYFVRGRSFV